MNRLGQNGGFGSQMRTRHLLVVGALALQAGLLAGPAQAQEAEPAAEGDAIVVSGYRYLSEDTSGTTGLPLSLEKVPQSITLISEDFLEATDAKTLGDVAQYTPGALFDGNPGGTSSVIKLRGFAAGNAIDGLNVGALDYEPDFATLERLEIVKGPTSVVYGAANPGGIINQVTKSAHAGTPSHIELLGGSWDRWRIEGQVAGALNDAGTVHVIGVAVHEEGGSFMERIGSAKTVLYAGIDADLSPELTAYIHGGYERYRRTSFDGIPTLPDGSPAPVGRSFFIGSGDFELVTPVVRVNGGLDWEASSALSVSLKVNYLRSNTTGESGFGYDLQPNGDFLIAINKITKSTTEAFSAGLSGVYKFDDLGLADSFITVAANYQDYETQQAGTIPDTPLGDTANIFDGVDAIETLFNSRTYPGFDYGLNRRLRYFTLSTQASIKVAEPLTLLGGISWAKPDVSKQSGTGAWQDFSGDSQTSLRLAATLEPVKGLNFYASYSESFQPQLFIDAVGDVLPPLTGEQYEVGVKYVSPDRRILLTAALFDVRQANQARYDQTIDLIDRYAPVGQVRHRGFEMQAVGEIMKGWQVNAGLALLDPTIREDDDATMIGKTLTFLPKSTASIYTSYELGGAFVGGGIRYVGSVKTDFDRATRDIASYTLVDASAGYDFGRFRMQVNVKNLFDKHYFVNNYQTLFYGNVVGEPRSATVSLRANF